MRILLTNDDGIHAPGLWALHVALSRRHDVTVVAPDRERTGVGHAITLHQPLRAARLAVNGGGVRRQRDPGRLRQAGGPGDP